jgi:gliding motility-associated-like protein
MSGGVPPYTWSWNGGSTDTVRMALAVGSYSFTVTDQNQCVRDTVADVKEGICNDIVVYNALTPNGDGVNDVWVIKGIQDYPDASVEVFDKWGDRVYQKDHYLNEWDGHGSNGSLLPDGTYFYIIKLNAVNASGGTNVKTGSILIKR